MSALATIRWRIWSFGADTGTFTQIALNAFRGFYDTSELGSHFHVHWAPLLATLYPFAMLTHSGLAIQIAQTVLVGLGIFPFFALVRRYVDTRPASTLAGLTLLYPPLLAVAFDEFHEIAFYPVIVFALLWAIDAGRWPWAWAFALLSLGVREEALLVDAVFGVLLVAASLRRSGGSPRGVLFFEPREPRPTLALGLGLAIFGPAVFAIYFAVVAPALGGWTASHFYDYPFARGPLRLIEAIFTRPFDVARAIATPGRATYLLEAFAPVLFIGLRSRWMFVVIPGLAIVTLSSDAIAWRMGTHYAGLWAPWLLVATAHAIVRIARSPSGARSARRISRAILTRSSSSRSTRCTQAIIFGPRTAISDRHVPHSHRYRATRASTRTMNGSRISPARDRLPNTSGTPPHTSCSPRIFRTPARSPRSCDAKRRTAAMRL